MLRLNDAFVFGKGGHHALVDGLSHVGVIARKAVRLHEEVVRAAGCFRGDGLTAQQRHEVRFTGSRLTGRCPGLQQQHARHQIFIDPGAIHDCGHAHKLTEVRCQWCIAHFARDAHTIVEQFDLRACGGNGRGTTQSFFVHIGQVREVQHVVANQFVTGLIVQIGGLIAPIGVIQSHGVGDQCRVDTSRVAHPYPHPLFALHHRISTHACCRRDGILAGDFDA